MSTNDKYLVLRGKNKDIYFIQKRVSKKISNIIGKDFIKKSLETNNIIIARERRDKILKELKDIEQSHKINNVRIDSKNIGLEENKYVPIKDIPSEENDDKSDGYFSIIDYSNLPKKEDILSFLDKITPFAIVFLMILVTLLV